MSIASKIEKWLCRILRIPTCQELEAHYYDFLAQAMSDSEKRAIERHLNICRRCRKFFASYKRVAELSPQWESTPVQNPDPEKIFLKISKKLNS